MLLKILDNYCFNFIDDFYFLLSHLTFNSHLITFISNTKLFVAKNKRFTLFSEIFKTVYKYSFEYKDVIKMWIGPKLVVFLTHPQDIELILSSHVHIDKSTEYRFFQPWLGNGLLISTGPKWRAHRKLIAPTFHLNVLKSFIDLFNANSRHVVKKLAKENGKEFDAHDYMSEATVEILLGK